MPECLECNEQVSRKTDKSCECAKCNGIVHLACANVNITREEFNSLKKGVYKFICTKCRDNATSQSNSTPANNDLASVIRSIPENITQSDFFAALEVAIEQGQRNVLQEYHSKMVNSMKEFQDEQKKFNTELSTSIDNMKSEIADHSKRIDILEFDSGVCTEDLKNVKVDNEAIHNRMVELERSLNFHEQSSLMSSMDIRGLPVKPDEDLKNTFCRIAASLNVEMTQENIVNIYRVKNSENINPQSSQSLIRAKLSRQDIRDKILNQRKTFKNFTTMYLGWPEAERANIYLQETLTPFNRRIHAAALTARKSNIIKYLWIAGGKIFCRKEDGSRRILLSCLQDVHSLK
ncbi:uncharacterized protein LOC127290897 [Leptopilina boulardi]|uniref:uncharacterized protein LOC127290897 n=1 Tax=Leptopilina boulardi TaxID=63433 RepID=UPI0021F60ECE|nr:uncharacterized protein LOC127290897 [Leptopilina boulardi]